MKMTTACILVLMATLLIAPRAYAGDVIRANNNTALNLSGAWVGGVLPGANDVAVWDSTVTVDRSSAIGASQSWQGIRIADTGGTLMTISATTGAVLDLGSAGINMSAANADLAITAGLNLGASQTWSVASGRTLSTSSATATTGNSALQLTGPGTIVMGTTGAFGTGTVTLDGGIRIRSNGATARNLTNSFVINSDIGVGSTAVAGAVAFYGNVDIGSATRTISIQNSDTTGTSSSFGFGGSSQVSGTGELRLVNGNASGVVRVLLTPSSPPAFSFQPDLYVGSNVILTHNAVNNYGTSPTAGLTVDGRFRLGNGGTGTFSQTVKSLSGSGTLDSGQGSGSSQTTLTINGGAGTGTTTFSGLVENGAFGITAITKSGSTTQILGGNNTYTGQTQVGGGTLLVNGNHVDSASVTGRGYASLTDGHYLVANGATLGGTGRIAGNNSQASSNMVYVQSGGILAPGQGIGTLTLDGGGISGSGSRVLNMASGAVFDFQLSGLGSNPDRIDFWNFAGGDLLLNSNTLNLSLADVPGAGTYTVDLIRFFSDSGTTLTASGIASGLALGTLGTGIESASIIYGTNAISLQYTTIPEPSTYFMLLGGLALLAVLRHQRKP